MEKPKNKILSKEGDQVIAGQKVQVDYTLIYVFSFLILEGITSALFSARIEILRLIPSVSNLILVMVAALIFLLILIFQPLFIKSRWLNILLAFVYTALLISFFFDPTSGWIIGAGVIFFISYILGLRKGRKELDDSLTISFLSFIRSYMAPIILGLSIFVAMVFAGFYSKTAAIPFSVYNAGITAVTPAVRTFVPDFEKNITVDKFFSSAIKQQLTANKEFGVLSRSDQEKVIADAGLELRNKISDLIKFPVAANESAIDYAYRVLNRYLEAVNVGRFHVAGPFVVAFILFYLLRLFFLVGKEVVFILSTILYYLLQAFGLFSIKTETRQKEVIVVR